MPPFLFKRSVPLSLHLHLVKNDLKHSQLTVVLLILTALVQGCAGGKMVSVLAGDTELIYRKSQSPDNLVKEIRYYPNGDTLSVTPMLKGAVDGVVSTYHKGNLLKEQVSFENGTQNGPFKRYDKDGVLVFEGQLKNGLKSGIWTTWYDEVQKQEERLYKSDVPSGKWTYWYIDGSIKREEVYQDGKLLEEKDF